MPHVHSAEPIPCTSGQTCETLQDGIMRHVSPLVQESCLQQVRSIIGSSEELVVPPLPGGKLSWHQPPYGGMPKTAGTKSRCRCKELHSITFYVFNSLTSGVRSRHKLMLQLKHLLHCSRDVLENVPETHGLVYILRKVAHVDDLHAGMQTGQVIRGIVVRTTERPSQHDQVCECLCRLHA